MAIFPIYHNQKHKTRPFRVHGGPINYVLFPTSELRTIERSTWEFSRADQVSALLLVTLE